MDCKKTIEFWQELKRICAETKRCGQCVLYNYCEQFPFDIEDENIEIEKIINIVQEYSDSHPVKTRKSEFLKQFPNAQQGNSNGGLDICPRVIDKSLTCPSHQGRYASCPVCKSNYWNQEIK